MPAGPSLTAPFRTSARVLRVSLEARDEPARDVLLHIITATSYRFYWLAREGPFRQGWVINLMPLTGRIVKEAGGGFTYPWTLWPGAKLLAIPL